MNSPYNVIIRPVITERAYDMMEDGKYTFEVARQATKGEIRDAIQKLFKVHVVSVHTLNVKPKNKRLRLVEGQTRRWKKAIVKLAEGEQIEIFAANNDDSE